MPPFNSIRSTIPILSANVIVNNAFALLPASSSSCLKVCNTAFEVRSWETQLCIEGRKGMQRQIVGCRRRKAANRPTERFSVYTRLSSNSWRYGFDVLIVTEPLLPLSRPVVYLGGIEVWRNASHFHDKVIRSPGNKIVLWYRVISRRPFAVYALCITLIFPGGPRSHASSTMITFT